MRKAAEADPDRGDVSEAIRAAEGVLGARSGGAPEPAAKPPPPAPSDRDLESQAAGLLVKGLKTDASAIYKRIQKEFPGTETAARAEAVLKELEKEEKNP